MSRMRFGSLAAGAVAILCAAGVVLSLHAQQPAASGGVGSAFFSSADANKDGTLSREELRAAFAGWVAKGDKGKAGYLNSEQFAAVVGEAFPASEMASMFSGGGAQPQTPKPEDVTKVMASLPAKAMATPAKPRKVLVLAKARGFVHSCIPLAAKTIEEMGKKTGAWATTVSYDASVVTAENLKQYDVLLLDNTTGAFLDEPGNPAVHEARKKALLDFVRAGKGLVGIHAASDSYHEAEAAPAPAARGGASPAAMPSGLGGMIASRFMLITDTNGDQKVTAPELAATADALYAKMDTAKSGRLSQSEFQTKLVNILFVPAAGKGRPGRDSQKGTWPEFNRLVGGYFKWHWMFPTHIVYKIDDPNSPLTTMFRGQKYSLDDETYTFSVNANGYSRANQHILTSVDYAAMGAEDKEKEDNPREDHDYGLSWIRREGQGRVFYEAHGHDESVYADKTFLLHVMAGVQYAAGDLKANDAPSKQ
jgi:type 1 glutamine amidotransferase